MCNELLRAYQPVHIQLGNYMRDVGFIDSVISMTLRRTSSLLCLMI